MIYLIGILFSVYALALLTGTHLPPSNVVSLSANDKLLHLGAYAGLAGLAGIWLTVSGRWNRFWVVVVILVLAIFAALDELTQPWVGRQAEWYDWLADLAGILLGLSVWRFCLALRMLCRPSPASAPGQ